MDEPTLVLDLEVILPDRWRMFQNKVEVARGIGPDVYVKSSNNEWYVLGGAIEEMIGPEYKTELSADVRERLQGNRRVWRKGRLNGRPTKIYRLEFSPDPDVSLNLVLTWWVSFPDNLTRRIDLHVKRPRSKSRSIIQRWILYGFNSLIVDIQAPRLHEFVDPP